MNRSALPLLTALILSVPTAAAGADLPTWPGDKSHFFDVTGTQVEGGDATAVEQLLKEASDKSQIHCRVAVIDQMSDYEGPEEIRAFTARAAERWGFSKKRGMLVLFSLQDRKFGIHLMNLPDSLHGELKAAIGGKAGKSLKMYDIPKAMRQAAGAIKATVPEAKKSRVRNKDDLEDDPAGGAGGLMGCFCSLVALVVVVLIIIFIVRAVTRGSRGYGSGGYHGGHGGYHGGGGYRGGGGGGGPGFFSGMLAGGALGYMLGDDSGSSRRSSSSGWSSSSSSSSTSSSSSGSWGDSGGSSSYEMDSYGGEDFDGGTSYGEW